MDIIFATKNKHKMEEIRSILDDASYSIISMEEAGIGVDVDENGITFEENALKKATTIMGLADKPTLADDSGLEIDYLEKQPGVHSARYMGENTPYEIKNNRILELLTGVPDEQRTARFVCVIAAAFPDGRHITARGVVEGHIAHQITGSGGFGYDPIFCPGENTVTMAELTMEEKNRISHRGMALRLMKEKLADISELGSQESL